MSINWRASLVPAAAVIPAPIAHIKVVAVKKLVVGFLLRMTGPSHIPNMAMYQIPQICLKMIFAII